MGIKPVTFYQAVCDACGKPVTFYQAVCDNCGKAHEGPDGIEAWSDENGAMEMALGSDWYSSDDGHLYCDDCRWNFDGSQEEGES